MKAIRAVRISLYSSEFLSDFNFMILNPDLLLSAYSQGYFPMADSHDGKIYWHSPDPRAVFPLGNISIARSVRQLFKKGIYQFSEVRRFVCDAMKVLVEFIVANNYRHLEG